MLLSRGFRRCGDNYYVPINHKNCCPSYIIRLNFNNFKINKNQRKVLNKFNKYLSGEKVDEKKEEVIDTKKGN